MGIPRSMLPEIRSSSEQYGEAHGHGRRRPPDRGHPRRPAGGAVRADRLRSAATAKNTYGTGSFLLVNTGEEIARTEKLLTSASATRSATRPAHYVLEGSIAVTGALIQWLRDRLKIIDSAAAVEELARSGRRQRRRLLRAGVQRAVRALLARRRARRDRRPDRLREPGPHRARRARGRRLAVEGGRRRGQRRRRRPVHRAARRRRHDRERAADAVPGRRARRPRDPPGGDRDDRARRRLRRRPRDRASGPARTSCASAGRRTSAGSRTWTPTTASASTRSGRRPSSGRSTGRDRAARPHPRARDDARYLAPRGAAAGPGDDHPRRAGVRHGAARRRRLRPRRRRRRDRRGPAGERSTSSATRWAGRSR